MRPQEVQWTGNTRPNTSPNEKQAQVGDLWFVSDRAVLIQLGETPEQDQVVATGIEMDEYYDPNGAG